MNAKSLSEIQKILNVIDRALKDVEMLKYLPASISQIPEELLQQLEPEVQTALKNLFDEEANLDLKMSQQKEAENSKTSNSDQKVSQRSIQEAAAAVKNQTLLVLHLLAKHNSLPILKKFYENQALKISPTMYTFYSVMIQLSEVWNDKLHTTMEEEQMRMDQKNETAAREKKASADMKALQRELAAERSIREREVSLKEDALTKLKEEILSLKSSTAFETQEFESKLQEKENHAVMAFQNLQKQYKQEIENKKNLLEKMKTKHSKEEKELLIARRNYEQKLSSTINNYDEFMNTTTDAINELKKEYELDEKKVQYYNERIQQLHSDREARKQELRSLLTEKRKLQQQRQDFVEKVIKLQRLWRRRVLKKSQKKEKSKKKKSKSPKRKAKK